MHAACWYMRPLLGKSISNTAKEVRKQPSSPSFAAWIATVLAIVLAKVLMTLARRLVEMDGS